MSNLYWGIRDLPTLQLVVDQLALSVIRESIWMRTFINRTPILTGDWLQNLYAKRISDLQKTVRTSTLQITRWSVYRYRNIHWQRYSLSLFECDACSSRMRWSVCRNVYTSYIPLAVMTRLFWRRFAHTAAAFRALVYVRARRHTHAHTFTRAALRLHAET